MRAIGLRVAGLVCAVSAAAAAPAILAFPELKALEAKVAAHPDDRDAAALLGQNYAIAIVGVTELSQYNIPTRFAPPGEAASYSRNALAQTHAAPVLGPAGTALWNYGMTRQDNGATRDLALGCIEHAIEMEPAEAGWRRQHMAMTLIREQFPMWRHVDSRAALALVEEDFGALKGAMRAAQLGSVALLAYRADDLARAEEWARELLVNPDSQNWNAGNALFQGNEVLGLVALRRGDLAGARTHLKLSGETKGSPQLNSFGPSMGLAAALVDAGEKDSVVAFLEQCKAFWKMDRGKLNEWQVLVRGGVKPSFGPNMFY